MKRDEALHPLSHQHHNALVGCLLIRKGILKNADRSVLKDFTLSLYNDDIQHHLRSEEKYIYPHLDRLHLPYKEIITREHETIRVLAERIRVHENGYLDLATFADFLESHIRFEERVVFNRLQESLDEQGRNSLQQDIAGINARKCSDYPVKFWE